MSHERQKTVPDIRSALYMPASRERVLAKGPSLAADAIIIDLEDSVAPDAKHEARQNAVDALTTLDYGNRVRALRINAPDTPWYESDVQAVLDTQPDAVVLPKVESAEAIVTLSNTFNEHGMPAHTMIWAMIESPAAILNASAIASIGGRAGGRAVEAQTDRLAALLIGNNDMARAANMPITKDRCYLVPWLMQLVAVAHAHALLLLDGVFNDFRDASGFLKECEQGVAMGMHGKTLIHPSQLEMANTAFSPKPEELNRAKAIVEAFSLSENRAAGVLQIDGQMVERLHLHMAERLLQRAERLSD